MAEELSDSQQKQARDPHAAGTEAISADSQHASGPYAAGSEATSADSQHASGPHAAGPEAASPDSQQKQAYEALREGIVYARYKPGVRLPMKRLCEDLGLGRTPIREALVRLQQEGLVHTIPHSGTYISYIDLHAAESARYVRKNLETAVAAECCGLMGPDGLARLDEVLAWQREAAQARDAHAFFTCGRQFYRQLFESAGKLDVWQWIDGLSVSLDRIRWLATLTEKLDWNVTLDQHAAVCEAIAAGDVETVCALETQYLNSLLICKDIVIERFPDYFEPDAAFSSSSLQSRGNA